METYVEISRYRASVQRWLEEMGRGLAPGRFRFAGSGSTVPTSGHAGQVSTCFAMKIAWQTGLWEQWPEQQRAACLEFVKSFQTPDGLFLDPWLFAKARFTRPDLLALLLRRASLRDVWERRQRNVIAESRQSAATLLMAGEHPMYRVPLLIPSPADPERFLSRLEWRNPWTAGSRISHLLFSAAINGTPEAIVDPVVKHLNGVRDSTTGCWYRGSVSDTYKLNGAMKVLSGLQWLDVPYPDCTGLMDFALAQPFRSDGCSFVDQLFVVHEARKGCPAQYREAESREIAQRALAEAAKFAKPDGAFSFHHRASQSVYYGVRIGDGRPCSDLHGTVIITWAIALALDLLGAGGELGWRAARM